MTNYTYLISIEDFKVIKPFFYIYKQVVKIRGIILTLSIIIPITFRCQAKRKKKHSDVNLVASALTVIENKNRKVEGVGQSIILCLSYIIISISPCIERELPEID